MALGRGLRAEGKWEGGPEGQPGPAAPGAVPVLFGWVTFSLSGQGHGLSRLNQVWDMAPQPPLLGQLGPVTQPLSVSLTHEVETGTPAS